MTERSNVGSIEALAGLRNSLILFRDKAEVLLEEVSSEVYRTKAWIEDDQQQHWRNELRERNRKLERAREEWLNARLADLQTAGFYKARVNKAMEEVEQAENKLRILRKWAQQFDTYVSPLMKKPNQARFSLDSDVPRAVEFLAQIIEILGGYVGGDPGAGSADGGSDGKVEGA
jgi:hypothetical protein